MGRYTNVRNILFINEISGKARLRTRAEVQDLQKEFSCYTWREATIAEAMLTPKFQDGYWTGYREQADFVVWFGYEDAALVKQMRGRKKSNRRKHIRPSHSIRR